jgi:hypothetical protein
MILVEYQEKFFTAPAYELWKESLNRDGYQFHQYQQNEQSSLILIELNEHKKTQVLAWDRHTNVVRLNWLKGFPPSSRENVISNVNAYISLYFSVDTVYESLWFRPGFSW